MHTSAINAIGAGLNVFVAVTLVVAALLKMRDIQPAERLLVATLPRWVWRFPGVDSRGMGRAAALIEAGGGVALLAAPRAAYPLVSAALIVPLLVIVAIAARAAIRRLPCGCFGQSLRRAGRYEIGRALSLVLATLTLTMLTWFNSAADPTVHSLTVGSWALAAALTVAAVAPAFRTWFGRRDSARISRAPADVSSATLTGAIEHSRRGVLHGIGLVAVMAGAAAVLPNALAASEGRCASTAKSDPPICAPRCQAAYDRCYGDNPAQKQCCIDCYVSCQNYEHNCTPDQSCGGSWHDPFGFGF